MFEYLSPLPRYFFTTRKLCAKEKKYKNLEGNNYK